MLKQVQSRSAVFFISLWSLFVFTSCDRVEGTGRGHLLLTSQEDENKMGEQAYQEVISKEKRSTDASVIAQVERVGRRLIATAPNHGFNYEFTVLESDTVNAFCLPGGKVCVYTGILPYCKNEAGLATVMAHEIAHAIARHGGERMSQGKIVDGLSVGLDALIEDSGISPTTEKIAMTAFGVGTQYGVILPFSRKHELEADYLGLTYMAKAGYDPLESVEFWKRFATLQSNMPAYFGTHPSSIDRANQLNGKMPEALNLYESTPKYGSGELVPEPYRKEIIPIPNVSSSKPATKTQDENPKKKKKKK